VTTRGAGIDLRRHRSTPAQVESGHRAQRVGLIAGTSSGGEPCTQPLLAM
jgi:hypothetical protein